jgi:N-acetylmuramoyl-L-alanine amidase
VPINSASTPNHSFSYLLIAWVLLAIVPGNLGFFAMPTLGKAPLSESADASVLSVAPTPGPSTGDEHSDTPPVDAITALIDSVAGGDVPPLELQISRSLQSLMERPDVESLWSEESSQPKPPSPLFKVASRLASDEYLKSAVVGPSGYAPLFSPTGFSISDLFGLKVKNIVIDPGHGGKDPGAIGSAGHREKDITLDIAIRLLHRFARHPHYRVLLTRDRDVKMSLKERVAFAAEKEADLFVSIHVNSLPEQPVNLVETYYFGSYTDNRTLRLARLENQGSDYAVADFNTLIQKIGNTLKTQESRQLAADLQAELVSNLQQHDDRIIDAGIKTAPFVVLLGVDVPSVLAEVSCISNAEEESRLATGEHRSKIAASIERGIIRYLEKKSNSRLTADGESSNGAEKDQNG